MMLAVFDWDVETGAVAVTWQQLRLHFQRCLKR
jgi:hypothetical protein